MEGTPVTPIAGGGRRKRRAPQGARLEQIATRLRSKLGLPPPPPPPVQQPAADLAPPSASRCLFPCSKTEQLLEAQLSELRSRLHRSMELNVSHKQIERALSDRCALLDEQLERRLRQLHDALDENRRLALGLHEARLVAEQYDLQNCQLLATELQLARQELEHLRRDRERQASRGDLAYEKLREVQLEIDEWKIRAGEAERKKAERIYDECLVEGNEPAATKAPPGSPAQ